MADYINIKGNNIPIRASDPSNPILGEIWYNSTTNLLKGQGFDSGSWSSGTSIPSARFNMASAGTATAGIIAGGELAPGTRTGETQYFDGTTWTVQPATLSPAPNADGVKMAGTQTAGILSSFRGGGSPGPAYTDAREWNGSTWTTITSTSNFHSSSNFIRGGNPTAATILGGDNEIGGVSSNVEEWSGSAWASETALPAGRGNMGTFGSPTAGLMFGGNLGPGTPNRTNTSFSYDGSAWTAGGNLSEARVALGGAGTLTSGLAFGGYNPTPAATGTTDKWDGTSFSATSSMATARGGLGSTGDASGAYAIGGNPPVIATVEEFTSGPATVTISSS